MFRMLPGGPVFEAVPDPSPAAPGFAEPAEPAVEPEPFQVDQDAWERMEYTNGLIMEQLEQLSQATAPEPQGPQLPEDSLLTPQDLEVIGQIIQQQIAPFQETQQQWTQSEGMQRVQDVVADDLANQGDFLLDGSREKAIALAETLIPQFVQRHGQTPVAAEAAIREACTQVREWEKAVGEAYYERQMNQFKTLGQARPTPPASVPAGAETHITPAAMNERDVVKKYFG